MSVPKINLSIPGLKIEDGVEGDDTASYLITKTGGSEKLSPRHTSTILPPKKKIVKSLCVYYDTLSKSYSPELAALVTAWKGIDFAHMLSNKIALKKSQLKKISESMDSVLKIKNTVQYILRKLISALPIESADDLAIFAMTEIGVTALDEGWKIKKASDSTEELFFQVVADRGFGNKKQLLEIVTKIIHLRDEKGHIKPLTEITTLPVKERLTSSEATTIITLGKQLQKVYRRMWKKERVFMKKGQEAPPHKNFFETAVQFEDASEAKTFGPTPPIPRKDRKTFLTQAPVARNIAPLFETPKKRRSPKPHRPLVIVEDTSATSSPQTPVVRERKNQHSIVIGDEESIILPNSIEKGLHDLNLEETVPLHHPGVIVEVESDPTSEE